MPTLTPAYDNKIYQKYSRNSLAGKEKNKISFCQDFGLKYDKKTPLLCLSFPLTEKNNVDMLQEAVTGLLEQDVIIALVGIGTEKFQNFFEKTAKQNPKKIAIVSDNDENKRKLYAASDIFLSTCDTSECMGEMEKAMSYGTIPVTLPSEIVSDYDATKESGNAFIYKEKSPWNIFAAVIRALENFKFPYDWKNIQANAMNDEGEDELDEE